MKRISLSVLAVAFTLTVIGYVYSEPSPRVAPKMGKALIKKLPAGIEGVELAGNAVRVKAGYKFVKHGNGTVTVARMAGGGRGLGLGGSWSCNCKSDGGGTCTATTRPGALICESAGKCNRCELTLIDTHFSGGVIILERVSLLPRLHRRSAVASSSELQRPSKKQKIR